MEVYTDNRVDMVIQLLTEVRDLLRKQDERLHEVEIRTTTLETRLALYVTLASSFIGTVVAVVIKVWK